MKTDAEGADVFSAWRMTGDHSLIANGLAVDNVDQFNTVDVIQQGPERE
jgi:hypothetical protein